MVSTFLQNIEYLTESVTVALDADHIRFLTIIYPRKFTTSIYTSFNNS